MKKSCENCFICEGLGCCVGCKDDKLENWKPDYDSLQRQVDEYEEAIEKVLLEDNRLFTNIETLGKVLAKYKKITGR